MNLVNYDKIIAYIALLHRGNLYRKSILHAKARYIIMSYLITTYFLRAGIFQYNCIVAFSSLEILPICLYLVCHESISLDMLEQQIPCDCIGKVRYALIMEKSCTIA